MQPIDPQILVVSEQVRLVLGEYPTEPAAHDILPVDDVGDAVQYRPLVGCRSRPEVPAGVLDERPDEFRRPGLDLGRIVVAHQSQEVVLIGIRAGNRIGGRGAEARFGHGLSSISPARRRTKAASSRTGTPSSSALASFVPARGPAIT